MRTLRTITVTRYVTPLREGGSLPAIVEADDDGMYVLKFRGAGHGTRALVAELVSGEIGRALGLPVPDIVLASLDPDLARTEPDPEIHALIHDSAGLNLALDYLPGAVGFDPIVHTIPVELASRIVWFDALVSNVDRTPRNTNMLMWHRAPWLIDHGSTLYFHHTEGWERDLSRARAAFPGIKDHVLLRHATTLEDEDERMARVLTEDVIEEIVRLVPDAWLADGANAPAADRVRAAYRRYLVDRLTPPRGFVEEAARAR
ncbi:MAG: aminotransferase class I and II [Vicinamibacteraceae bacterium]|nr:aminotransferase class I and II [Vicinamibacteraceae bacterium]